MPWGLKRFQQSRQLHYLTFSCYRRQAKFSSARPRFLFESALEQVRKQYDLCLYGYVVMPEHVHLLVNEPERRTLAVAVQALKQSVARRLALRASEPFWQARYYDFNVWSRTQIHRETALHPPQPGDARTGGAARRLAVEQFPALRVRRGRDGGD